MCLTEKRVRTIVREELISRHGFSVDGIKASTVETIRLNAKMDVILRNIQMLLRIREEEGKRKPVIIIRYVLMRSNIEELPDAVQYWAEMGVDRVECTYISLCNDIDRQESLYYHQELMEKVFNEARRVAKYYSSLTLKLPPTIRQVGSRQHHPKRCIAPWNYVYLCTDGRVLPCTYSWGTINMGNFYDNDEVSFKDIWNNAQYQALRCTVNNDTVQKYYPHCARCESRLGWGRLESHLGDETWLENLALDVSEKTKVIAHRRRKIKKTH
jgi:MoaA/NifB/PqqE/SkfB family radical SAM enzyme